MLILVTILAAAFLILCYYKPLWGIYVIAAGLPSFLLRFKVGGIPFTFLEVMVIVLFLVMLLRRKIDFKRIYHDTFFWPLVAVLAFATISVFVSPKTEAALGIWKAYFIEPALLYAVVVSGIPSRKALGGLFWALGVSVAYLSIIAIWQKFSGWGVPQAFMAPDGSVDRVVSILNYPNALGLYIGPIIVLFTGWLVASLADFKKNFKTLLPILLQLAVIALGFATIILAKSEAAALAVIAVWLVMGVAYKKTRYWVIAAAVAGVVAMLVHHGLWDYLIIKLTLSDYSGGIRRIMWDETWKMLQYRWLWGAGLSGYQYYIWPYHLHTFEIFPYPHQIFFNFWSELGLGGLAAFVWLFGKYFWHNFRTTLKNPGAKIIAFTLVCVAIEIIIHGLVDAPYFKNDLSMLFWIIVAIASLNYSLFSLDGNGILKNIFGKVRIRKNKK